MSSPGPKGTEILPSTVAGPRWTIEGRPTKARGKQAETDRLGGKGIQRWEQWQA